MPSTVQRFAPVLTERFPYPTQPEANAAYRRLLATAPARSHLPCLDLAVRLQAGRARRANRARDALSRSRRPLCDGFSGWHAGPAITARDDGEASIITVRCGTCSRFLRRAPTLRGAIASGRPRTSGGGSLAGRATNRRRACRLTRESTAQGHSIDVGQFRARALRVSVVRGLPLRMAL